MKNFLQCVDEIEFTAPAGGVLSGSAYLIGSLVVVAQANAAAGDRFIGATEGVFVNMPRATGTAWTEGQLLYWDSAAGNFATAPSATARRAAFAVLAAAAADVTGTIALTGSPAVANVA